MTVESFFDEAKDRPQILGTAKVASSILFPNYPQRECENLVRILVESITGLPWHHARLYPEERFTLEQFQRFKHAVGRLLVFEPLQYILGEAYFDGLRIVVGPGVLIPRPETEELLEWASSHPFQGKNPRILDLCTGSGCLALGLKSRWPGADATGLDFSQDALEFAQLNSQNLGLEVNWVKKDLLLAEPGDFHDLDLITCNPPYIPNSEAMEMPQQVKAFEPGMALFVPDQDPLLFYNKVCALGMDWLRPGGGLYFEIHEGYAAEVMEAMQKAGYASVEIRKDMQYKDRMAAGIRP